ncbi:aspartate/glutamate racemase family protein [Desulfosporosinus metallidurans]|uniref:Hydantoin racemase n=1 Tax=Desulfosporosinus metallidurans TaxID=1888891 RepID=A0A1Q8QH00_9FIRM|nr:aspartate/glutamate racemase family protein [Desulfosporosinus metallidurans]OLN26629.1 Hydantoin racemase [Desulfosporosinus metallidurans]
MTPKKILWINPVGTDTYDAPIQEYLDTAKDSETIIDVVSLSRGPLHLEYSYYEALVLLDTLNKVKSAEKEGYDAAVIGCFYDPGLMEAREILDKMVVTAPAEASMHIAATMGHKFSIIVGRNKWIPQMMENVVNCGLKDKFASFKSVGLGVYDFHKDEKLTERLLKEAAKEAVEKDGAEVIILGCTIQFGFYKELQKYLGVPVIDAVLAPLKWAEFLVELQGKFAWSHSKIGGYETPPKSEIESWGLESQYNMNGLWRR